MPYESGFGWWYPMGTDTSYFDQEPDSIGRCSVCGDLLYEVMRGTHTTIWCDNCGNLIEAVRSNLEEATKLALAAFEKPSATRSALQKQAVSLFENALIHAADAGIDPCDYWLNEYFDACEAIAGLHVHVLEQAIKERQRRNNNAR